MPSPRAISPLPSEHEDSFRNIMIPRTNGLCEPWILSSADRSNSQPITASIAAQAKFNSLPRRQSALSISSVGSSVVFTRNTNPSNAITKSTSPPKEGGNYLYSSPEILLGDEYDYMVDWWGFGVLMFHFISGITPFAVSDSPQNSTTYDICDTVNNIISQTIVNWDAVPGDVSSDCKEMITALLCEPFPKRLGYDSCQQVLDHKYFNGLGIDSLSRTTPSNKDTNTECKTSEMPGENLYSQPGPLQLIAIGKIEESRYLAVPRGDNYQYKSHRRQSTIEGCGTRGQAALPGNSSSMITIAMLQRDSMPRLEVLYPLSSMNSYAGLADNSSSTGALVSNNSSFKGKMGWLQASMSSMPNRYSSSRIFNGSSRGNLIRMSVSSNMTQHHHHDVALAFQNIDAMINRADIEN